MNRKITVDGRKQNPISVKQTIVKPVVEVEIDQDVQDMLKYVGDL